MSERTFDRETVLDLTVNVIPLGIILFFVVVFLLVTPWSPNLIIEAISMGLLVIPFVSLAALTYVSGRVIARDEGKAETTATTELSADAELEGSQANRDADADDYSMVEDYTESTDLGTDETESDDT